MADNVAITAGSGTTIAADDIGGGVLAQRVKPVWGVDGTGTDVSGTNPMPVAQYSGGAAIDWTSGTAGVPAGGVSSVQGFGYDIALSTSRPANTTAYPAGYVVGATAAALTFTGLAPAASSIIITGAQLELDITAIPSGMTSFRLHLYSVTPPSALANNAAWDLPSGDRASYLGYIDLGTPVDLGSTCYCEVANVNKQIRTAGANVFGYLVTNGGFTPAANSEVYKITLHAVGV